MAESNDHLPFCNNPHGPIGGDCCCCAVVSKRDLANISEFRQKAHAFDIIKEAVLELQQKLDAKKCNRWDCLDKAMHIIDVASMQTTGDYLK